MFSMSCYCCSFTVQSKCSIQISFSQFLDLSFDIFHTYRKLTIVNRKHCLHKMRFTFIILLFNYVLLQMVNETKLSRYEPIRIMQAMFYSVKIWIQIWNFGSIFHQFRIHLQIGISLLFCPPKFVKLDISFFFLPLPLSPSKMSEKFATAHLNN